MGILWRKVWKTERKAAPGKKGAGEDSDSVRKTGGKAVGILKEKMVTLKQKCLEKWEFSGKEFSREEEQRTTVKKNQ